MQIFSAKIRLGGDMHHEVEKSDLTAAEVVALRALHGRDGVLNLTLTGEREVDHEGERQRLRDWYGGSEANRHSLASLLDAEHVPLPEVLPGFEPGKRKALKKVVPAASEAGEGAASDFSDLTS